VLSPDAPSSENVTVFTTPTEVASADTRSSSGSTARFSGIVTDRPAQSGPICRRNAGSCSVVTSIAS